VGACSWLPVMVEREIQEKIKEACARRRAAS
jgi:hypothetical protein